MKLLLAEDEKALSRAYSAMLERKGGYQVDAVYDGEAALQAAREHVYDACIFDIMMPKMDGITVLKTLRAEGNTTPILMLTAKSQLGDKVSGLDAGADDYLSKPVQMEELLARLRSLTRRSTEYRPKELRVGNLILDVEDQELRADSSIRLSKKEARLMEYLIVNSGKTFTAAELTASVWRDEEADDKVVWIYISYLKSKMEAIAADRTIEGEETGPFRLIEI
ncbi:MAG: response regulator transcription factor [Eubacterium sp.]|nr:response regulator transcription factor [Eubacterium sp.]